MPRHVWHMQPCQSTATAPIAAIAATWGMRRRNGHRYWVQRMLGTGHTVLLLPASAALLWGYIQLSVTDCVPCDLRRMFAPSIATGRLSTTPTIHPHRVRRVNGRHRGRQN